MGILIPVDIPDFLDASGHLAAPSQIIKKHEPAVKINALQDIVGHDDPEKGHIILLLLEFIIQISYKCIAAQKVFILLPLVQYSVPLHRTADGRYAQVHAGGGRGSGNPVGMLCDWR